MLMKSMVRGGLVLAASFCAVLFASCGITPLYYPPLDDKTPEEMFDTETRASLLKAGRLQSEDGDVTVEFTECPADTVSVDGSSLKEEFIQYAVRGIATIVDHEDKEKDPAEATLPVLLVPFRYADAHFFYFTLDQMYIMEKYNLHPEYLFMARPYAYILKAEVKDGGWEVGFVQFATKVLEVSKVAQQAQIDKDGTVFNPPAEILDMLKDPKNYELSSKMLFRPVKSREKPEAGSSL